jgi:hypothetical protein
VQRDTVVPPYALIQYPLILYPLIHYPRFTEARKNLKITEINGS